jgi:hypothetical protein
MKSYSLTHLSDATLLGNLHALVARDRRTTAELLAHIGEVESRRLHLAAGYASMFSYCVHVLHMSEDVAYKRIRAARLARRFPAILAAVAEARHHLTGIVLLSPYLNETNAHELLAAGAHKTKRQIEQLLANRFPRPDLTTSIRIIRPRPCQLVPEPVGMTTPLQMNASPTSAPDIGAADPEAMTTAPPTVEVLLASVAPNSEPPAQVSSASDQLVPERVGTRGQIMPLSPGRYGVKFTMSQSAHDKLRRAQELMSHQVPSSDIATVVERALESLIVRLERAKFARTDRPRQNGGQIPRRDRSRHIPAEVKRAVRERDGDQCTYVSAPGHRCTERKFLEYDHADPFAREGPTTVDNIRLRCRAHNQYEAECVFGMEFMKRKRADAQRQRAAGAS